ncbi:hypothetical protein C8R45DRAFT_414108 [Mycena sanguinolenta]|nr:hypothetical protein C8R45DRAFT_414108 [Mycena sanguinolenta]
MRSSLFIRTHSLPWLFPMAPSVAADITLGTAINFVDVVANIAQLTGVPYAGQVLSLASGILATVQRVRDNSKAFRQLAGDIQDLIVAVVESAGSLSNEMEKSLENLVSVLHNVNDLVSKRRLSHNIIRRALNSVADVSKIHDYRGQIRQALDLFKAW